MIIEIVKFKDGKYGVKKTSFFGFNAQYKDLVPNTHYWWNHGGDFFESCRGTEEEATAMYDYITDMGEPVND